MKLSERAIVAITNSRAATKSRVCAACGATVRYALDLEKKCWMCPLCDVQFPYLYWSIAVDRSYKPSVFMLSDKVEVDEERLKLELIISVAADSCQICGERNAAGSNDLDEKCRCNRGNHPRRLRLGKAAGVLL